MKTTNIYIFCCFILLLFGCKKNKSEVNYSFFVAGHTYGNPSKHIYGLYKPFVDKINYINKVPNLNFGVLTGDVVPEPTAAYWDSAIIDIKKINVPIYIATGNHDRGSEFEKRFTDYYKSFKVDNDLCIILTPTEWNIEGKQLDFLKKNIDDNNKTVNNIFIFCHELIWWSPFNMFKNVEINYRPHYPGRSNFWNEVEPVLSSIKNEIYIFAGDLGCTPKVSPYMYYKHNNITLIASGMGGSEKDNIIIVNVLKNGKVRFDLTSLNSSKVNYLGKLEDYILP